MPDLVDYYAVLGVPSTASADEIRKARQQLAKLYHPDRNKGPAAHQMMALVNKAASVLLDPAQRSLYDAALAREDTPPAASDPTEASPSPRPSPHPTPAPAHRNPARNQHRASNRTLPPRPAHHTPTTRHPSMLARALRSMLMPLVTAISWAAGIALGVAGLVIASTVETPWLRFLVFIALLVVSFAFPSAATAGVRRLLYGPNRDDRP